MSTTILEDLKEVKAPKGSTLPTVEVANVEQIGVTSLEVQNAAKGSLDFLAALIMPTIFTFNFPGTFQNVWAWLLSYVEKTRSFPQLALGLPRGFGKTTFMKIFIVYCILFTSKKFILVICETIKHADNILSDVIDMLEEPNIKLYLETGN